MSVALVLILFLTAASVRAAVLYPHERTRRYSASSTADTDNTTVVLYRDALEDARPANLSESVDLVARVSLRSFAFAFDAAAERRGKKQLGPLGHELRRLGGIADQLVHVVPERLVVDPRDPSARRRVALRDVHVVDKDALFMHNVGATQQLLADQQALARALGTVRATVGIQQQQVDALIHHLDEEATKQTIERRRIAEAETEAARLELEQTRVRADEDRKTLKAQHELELVREQEKHELARRRLEEEDAHRKAQNRDLVSLQEEANVRLEKQRRETEQVLKTQQLEADKHRALLERNTTLEKAALDVEGRIKQQRLNQDIEMAQLRTRLEADRIKLMQALQATFDNLGQGAHVLLADRRKLVQLVGSLVALAAGVFLSREAIRIVGKLIEQRLGKPSLVRETSRVSGIVGMVRGLVKPLVELFWRRRVLRDSLADVVLASALETRVREIARSTRNAIAHGAPYRHLLLYGPPGTGKTMVAKRLAKSSGMDYAILSGGDVGPLGTDAVTELHVLFHWANASSRGVLVFIDEAEAFLGCRATRKTHMSEPMRNALNALLFHTGGQSRKFMLVVATNRPEDLDAAVTDRIDDTLHFDLPETAERVRLLEMYFDEYVAPLAATKDSGAKAVEVQPTTQWVTRDVMKQYGAATTGMSGREIAKMLLYLQSVAYAQDELVVSAALVDRVVREKVGEHQRKLELKRGYCVSGGGNRSVAVGDGDGVFI